MTYVAPEFLLNDIGVSVELRRPAIRIYSIARNPGKLASLLNGHGCNQ